MKLKMLRKDASSQKAGYAKERGKMYETKEKIFWETNAEYDFGSSFASVRNYSSRTGRHFANRRNSSTAP